MIATAIELFKDLTQFEYGTMFFDLHNDYDCTASDYSSNTLNLKLSNKFTELELLFKNTIINKLKYENDFSGANIISTFYRGRCLVEDLLVEYDSEGRAYFYLEFETGWSLEFWAKEIDLIIKTNA